MTKLARRSAALLALVSIADVAFAQGQYSWDGFYAGVKAGRASNSTCNSWSLNGATIDPMITAVFNNRTCPNNSSFVGGVQIGADFQYKRLIWGFVAEFDDWGAKNHNRSLKYTGNV